MKIRAFWMLMFITALLPTLGVDELLDELWMMDTDPSWVLGAPPCFRCILEQTSGRFSYFLLFGSYKYRKVDKHKLKHDLRQTLIS